MLIDQMRLPLIGLAGSLTDFFGTCVSVEIFATLEDAFGGRVDVKVYSPRAE